MGQSARIVLRWKGVAGASGYRLQISPEPLFAKPVVDVQVKEPSYRWEELPSSTHYWRVRSIDEEGRPGEWSPPQPLATAAATLTAQAPSDGAVLPCSDGVELTAEASIIVTDFTFEVSPDGRFAEGVRELKATTASVRISGLLPGTWHWRVRGVDVKGRSTGATAPRRFQLTLPAPKPRALADAPFPQSVALAFGEVACARGYLVEAAHEKGESVKLDGFSSPITFRPGAPGEYRWRVFALDARGLRGEGSPELTFRVRLPPPQLKVEQKPWGPEVRWPVLDKAASYRVEVSGDDEAREGLVVGNLSAPPWRPTGFKPGAYLVRVFARDAAGRLSFPSELKAFTVPQPPSLALPVLLSPQPDSAVAHVVGESLTLRWTDVPEAARYSVQVDDGVPASAERSTVTVPGLGLGPHVVVLRAFSLDGKKTSDWSSPFSFTLVAPQVAVAVAPPPEPWRYPKLHLLGLAGMRSNLASLTSPEGTLALGWRPAFARGYGGVEASAAVAATGAQAQLEDVSVVGRAQLVPLSLSLTGHLEVARVRLALGVGPTLQLAFAQVGEGREARALLGVDAWFSAGYPLGPGVVTVRVGWRSGELSGATARLNAGGPSVALGYGFDLVTSLGVAR